MNKEMKLSLRRAASLAAAFLTVQAAPALAQSFGFLPLQSLGQTVNGVTVASPSADLLTASDGNFYSPLADSGYFRFTPTGTVSVVTNSLTYMEQLLYPPWWETVGDRPNALTQGADGNFYGTTQAGSEAGTASYYGVFFKLTSAGSVTVLYNFSGADGIMAIGSLVQGSDGAFYGVTGMGSAGTIFRVTSAGQLTVLHTFSQPNSSGINTDGAYPYAGLALGSDGNFYGTASGGGTHGVGTVFKITPSGTFTTLHSFAGTDGADPRAKLTLASDGNFYGTTQEGGTNGDGVVFRIAPTGTYSRQHSFVYTDGMNPASGLVESMVGTTDYLYGTASAGGANNTGSLFSITTGGQFSSLYSFTAAVNGINSDGVTPNGLSVGNDGNLFGATKSGGGAGVGELFELIVQKPTLTLKVSPRTVSPYQNATLKWTATSSTSCQASGAWIGAEPVSGNQPVSQSAAGTYNYKLTCYGPLGSVSKTATLTVSGSAAPTQASQPEPVNGLRSKAD